MEIFLYNIWEDEIKSMSLYYEEKTIFRNSLYSE